MSIIINKTEGGISSIDSSHVDQILGRTVGYTANKIYNELPSTAQFFNHCYHKKYGGYDITKTGWYELADYLKDCDESLGDALDQISDAFER